MTSNTKKLIKEIQTKVKSPVTGRNEFANEDAVIDHAIKTTYELMKKQRLLWNQYSTKLIILMVIWGREPAEGTESITRSPSFQFNS